MAIILRHCKFNFSDTSCKHSETTVSTVYIIRWVHPWKHLCGDAYLMVEQDEPTIVEVDGRYYELRFPLPGKRMGQAHGSTI